MIFDSLRDITCFDFRHRWKSQKFFIKKAGLEWFKSID